MRRKRAKRRKEGARPQKNTFHVFIGGPNFTRPCHDRQVVTVHIIFVTVKSSCVCQSMVNY